MPAGTYVTSAGFVSACAARNTFSFRAGDKETVFRLASAFRADGQDPLEFITPLHAAVIEQRGDVVLLLLSLSAGLAPNYS